MIGRMSLKIPISKSIIADMMVVHNTGIKAGEMRVEIKVTEIKIDPIMKREHDTFPRDANNRGRNFLTTSRSEDQSAAQATFKYSDVRIKDQQAATRSDNYDLMGCSSCNGYMSRATGQRYSTNTVSKMQVFNSMPPNQNPPPSTCKERTSALATWPFQASIDPLGGIRMVQSKNSRYKGAVGHE